MKMKSLDLSLTVKCSRNLNPRKINSEIYILLRQGYIGMAIFGRGGTGHQTHFTIVVSIHGPVGQQHKRIIFLWTRKWDL